MIKQLIDKYKIQIEENKQYIIKVKSMTSRQMTLDTKNVHILKTEGEIRALEQVINDLKKLL